MEKSMKLPVLTSYSQINLKNFLAQFENIKFITEETCTDFSGEFPQHNRFFTNGYIPVVGLHKKENKTKCKNK